jgi:hypothetical protein
MIETFKSGFYWLALALLVVSKLAVAIWRKR